MVCFRSRRLAAGLFVCSVVLGACGGKKEEGKAGEGGGGASAASNKDLDLIPAESEVVMGIDLAAAQKSALFRDYVLPRLMKSGDVQKVVETLKAKCSIDPMTAATKVTLGVRGVGTRNPDVVAVLHGVEKAKALPCIDQVKEELAAQKLEVAKDGDAVVMKSEQGDLAVTFTGDTTAVVVAGSRANKEGVLAAAQGKSALKTSKEFGDMYGRLQSSHTLWFVMRGDIPMVAKNLNQLGYQSRGIFGSADLSNGLAVDASIRFVSEEQASKAAELGASQSGMAAAMADKFDIKRDGADVRTTVVMSPEKLKAAMGFAANFLR